LLWRRYPVSATTSGGRGGAAEAVFFFTLLDLFRRSVLSCSWWSTSGSFSGVDCFLSGVVLCCYFSFLEVDIGVVRICRLLGCFWLCLPDLFFVLGVLWAANLRISSSFRRVLVFRRCFWWLRFGGGDGFGLWFVQVWVFVLCGGHEILFWVL
jgi:hypothetical protein